MLREWLYPPKCCGCKKLIEGGTHLCPRCKKELIRVKDPICLCCGKTVKEEGASLCYDCRKNPHGFVNNRSLYQYNEAASRLMYELKYGHNRDVAEFFGKEMAMQFRGYIHGLRVDGIVPIPLHKKRKRQRGYNQAELIAKEIGKKCKVPVYPDFLERVRLTRPQKELNDAGRKNNVKNAFQLGKNELQLNKILLVDDIYTTGATIDAAVRTLFEAGVQEVYGLTVCVGRG
ncbi:MAG: ComF family protein, partial [Lachnospiraceae bacterium]|nr:ComF family protein [Lachnospiraceae bacterium]